MTLTLHVTLSISDGQHKGHLAKQRSAIVLSVIMLSVIMPSVIMLSVIMLSVIMLSVIMLSVIMLIVAFYQILCLISLCECCYAESRVLFIIMLSFY